MKTKKERFDGKVVLLVHLTLKPGVDDDFINLVRNAPRRFLAERVREAMRRGQILQRKLIADNESTGVHHD